MIKILSNPKKPLTVLVIISLTCAVLAAASQFFLGGSSVYRATLYFEVKPIVNINTAGMPVELASWSGDGIKLECLSELEVMTAQEEKSVTFSQDDGFSVSIFTAQMLNYNIKIYLPQDFAYDEINIVSAGGDIQIDNYGFTSGIIRVATKNGGISVVNANALYYLVTESGDIEIDYTTFSSSTIIQTNSGGVNLSIPDYSAVNLDYNTKTGRLTSGDFFPAAFDGWQGAVTAQRGKIPGKLNVTTQSGDLVIKEKNTYVVNNYPVL